LKANAARARAAEREGKAWTREVNAACASSIWRCTSTWIEEGDGTRCAELTHRGSGATRLVKLRGFETVADRAAELARQLSE
jgi:hypothetical protein